MEKKDIEAVLVEDAEYLIIFNKVDASGNVFKQGSVSVDNLESMKSSGKIADYIIDDIGVKVFV